MSNYQDFEQRNLHTTKVQKERQQCWESGSSKGTDYHRNRASPRWETHKDEANDQMQWEQAFTSKPNAKNREMLMIASMLEQVDNKGTEDAKKKSKEEQTNSKILLKRKRLNIANTTTGIDRCSRLQEATKENN